jgi:hypothetical protein
MPLDLVVNNGLKIRLATAGSIPGPVSAPEEGENFAHVLIELEPRPVSSISLHHRPNIRSLARYAELRICSSAAFTSSTSGVGRPSQREAASVLVTMLASG